tara:strand:+ start:98 stop:1189 length:1092 start_codon:yes stop_codon:yes gene_type:complete
MQVITKNIKDLISAEYNPRQLKKEQFNQLKDSIKRFGLVDPVIINKNDSRKNIIIGGHQRTRVAESLGIEEVPCVEVDLTLDEERELNVRLNKNTGEWDFDILADMFDIDELKDWGFTDDELLGFELEEEKEGNIDDDEIPEVEEAVTKLGDLWILGEHRLLCGDSTKKENIELLLNGNKVDLLLTDPPYGIDADKMTLGTGKKEFYRGNWDSKKLNLQGFFEFTDRFIIWGGNYFTDILPINNDWLCWHKKNDNLTFSEFELAWTNLGKNTRHLSHHWGGEKKKHPTQKPLEVILWCLNIIDRFKNILDPFLGSGSTLIACEKTNRKCYGMELDPHYCDVIVKRWEEFTGKKAELYGKTEEV